MTVSSKLGESINAFIWFLVWSTPSGGRVNAVLQTSKCCADFLDCFVSARVANLLHLRDYQFEFLILRIEMRRDTHAGARTIVNDEFAANQFFRERRGVVIPNRDRATAAVRIFRTCNAKPGFLGQRNQVLSLPHTLFTDWADADCIDDLIA